SRLCENSNDRAAVSKFQSIFGRFPPLQARQSEKVRFRCAVFQTITEFSHSLGHFPKVGRPPRASAIRLEVDLHSVSSTRTSFAPGWHHDIIAAKLEAVRQRRIRRLIINVPPRHLKSHLGSVCFPAWCLGHDPSIQILCVSYAQDLADKLSRDCRQIVTG